MTASEQEVSFLGNKNIGKLLSNLRKYQTSIT
jgi:hypothetical protein